MAHEGVIVGRHAGKDIPDEYLNKVREEFDTCYGYAFAEDGSIQMLHSNGLPPADGDGSFQNTMKVFPQPSLLYLGSADTDYHEDDLQPFTILEDDEKRPLLVAFLEGDFSGFYQKESAHSNEFFVVNKVLREEVMNLWQDCEQDIDKLVTALKEPRTFRAMKKMFTGRGAIVLLVANGETIIYSENKDAGSFPWGWTTNKLDYSEEEPEKKEEETKPTAGVNLRAMLEAQKKGGKAKAETKTSVPETKTDTKVPDGTGKEKKEEPVNNKGEQIFFPPPDVQGKALRKWYGRNMQGGKPSNWESRPGIPESKLATGSPLRGQIKSFEELKTEESKGVTTVVPPVIPPGQKKEVMEKFLTALDDFLDEDKISSTEEEDLSFTEQTGFPLWKFLRMRYDTGYRKLAQSFPISAAVALNELRCIIAEKLPDLLNEPKAEEAPAEQKGANLKEMLAAQKKQQRM